MDGKGLPTSFADGGNVDLVSLSFAALESSWGTGESTVDTDLPGSWSPVGGTWSDTADGKQGTAPGDAF